MLTVLQSVVLMTIAVLCFHLAYQFPPLAFLLFVSLACLFPLVHTKTPRIAFYTGLVLGILLYAPQLAFFWNIFGVAAIGLWILLSVWMGIFFLLARASFAFLPDTAATLILPVLWTGFEYTRSELYYLRFAWLTPGLAFSHAARLQSVHIGSYGIGFLLMFILAILFLFPRKISLALGVLVLLGLAFVINLPPESLAAPLANSPFVVGIQTEEASETEVSFGHWTGRFRPIRRPIYWC